MEQETISLGIYFSDQFSVVCEDCSAVYALAPYMPHSTVTSHCRCGGTLIVYKDNCLTKSLAGVAHIGLRHDNRHHSSI